MGDILKPYHFPYARYPAVRVALCLIAGIVLGRYSGVIPVWVLPVMVAAVFGIEILVYRMISRVLSSAVRWMYLMLIILFGMAHVGQHSASENAIGPATLFGGLEGRTLTIAGVVRESRLNDAGSLNAVIGVDSVFIQGQWLRMNARMQVRSFRADSTMAFIVGQNRYVHADVEIRPFPQRRNPMAFDVARWLKSEGITVTGTLMRVTESLEQDHKLSWLWWRAGMHNLLDRSVDAGVRPLFKAILLGDKGDLDREVRTAFSRAGLSHLMAVSGMHVGFVLMPVWALIPWFWTHEAGRTLGLLIIAGILFFYAGLTGFSSSVSRASITACLLAVGKLFQRNRDSMNTTGVAAILLMVWNPSSIYDVGFQMSFIAVCVILVIGPVIRDWVPPRLRYGWRGNILLFLGISIVVQLGLFPILAGTFGEFSIAGPLANTIGVPVTQALFLWSMLALPIALVWESAATWVMIPGEYLGWVLLWLVEVVGTREFAWVRVTEISRFTPVIWFCSIGLLATIQTPQVRFKWLILSLCVLCLIRVERIHTAIKSDVLRVVVYDVGQGDAVLLQTPGGKHILYDTGVMSPFQNSGRSVILPDLQARGVTRLDAVILSHPHADHIGGMLTLIENIEIGVIYQAPLSYRSAVFSGYMGAAERAGIPIVEVKYGDVLPLDRAIRALVLHPNDEQLGHDPNAHSVSVKIIYGQTSLLLTGDAESIAENAMERRFDEFLKSDWYKAGHHGSKTSSNASFMRYVAPEYVAVSLGYRNRYRHPHREASQNIHKYAKDVGFTSLHGALIYESDGFEIRRKAF